MKRLRCLFLAAPLAVLAAPAMAATDPLRPPLDYGYTDIPPRMLTASEHANQMRVQFALRKPVFSRQKNVELGKIATLLVDPGGLIGLAELDKNRALLAWSSLEYARRPSPHFVVDLLPSDIENAPRPQEAHGLEDVRELLSKDAVGARGEKLGKVLDLIATLGDGTIVAVVIEHKEPLKNDRPFAIGWSAVKGRAANGDLQLAITEQELLQAPVLMTKAPAYLEVTPPVPESGSGGTRPTLNFGGQSAPNAPTRPK
jgi:hypothetical protein